MLFKKPVEEEIEIKEAEAEAEAPKSKEPQKFSAIKKTMIGQGVTFVGNFETADPIEINGAINGDIKSSDTVEINQNGSYTGNADIKNLLLHGSAQGKMNVEELSKLTSTASMRGTLATAKLVTEVGSKFDGDMKLFQNESPAAAPVQAPKEEPKAEEAQGKHAAPEKKPEPKLPPLQEGDVEVDEDFLFGKH